MSCESTVCEHGLNYEHYLDPETDRRICHPPNCSACAPVVTEADRLRADAERLTGERDKAREECGFEKGLRASMRIELNMFIRLNMEATARAEAAESALTDIAAMHKRSTMAGNEHWCHACEFEWPCPTFDAADSVVAGGASTTRETDENG